MKRSFQKRRFQFFKESNICDVSVLKELLSEYYQQYTNEDLLALWAFTGGVAKYVELLIDAGAVTREKMIIF